MGCVSNDEYELTRWERIISTAGLELGKHVVYSGNASNSKWLEHRNNMLDWQEKTASGI